VTSLPQGDIMRLITHYPYYLWRARALPHWLLRKAVTRTCFGYETMKPFFGGKTGLEFGGPSWIFARRRLIPVYGIARQIDNCRFSEQTIWNSPFEKAIFGSTPTNNFVTEASSPSSVEDERYDFVLASHVLEHLANPLRALAEWRRILRPGGTILVVVPHRAFTFDHRRPLSIFSHIQDDYKNNTQEDDTTTSMREDLPLSVVPEAARRRKDVDYIEISRHDWMEWKPVGDLITNARQKSGK